GSHCAESRQDNRGSRRNSTASPIGSPAARPQKPAPPSTGSKLPTSERLFHPRRTRRGTKKYGGNRKASLRKPGIHETEYKGTAAFLPSWLPYRFGLSFFVPLRVLRGYKIVPIGGHRRLQDGLSRPGGEGHEE